MSSVVKIVGNMKVIDRARLKSLMQREQQRFVNERPKSKALFERAGKSLLGGVPMNWMGWRLPTLRARGPGCTVLRRGRTSLR